MAEQAGHQIEISIGGLSPPLHKQLNLEPEQCEKWQKISDAIVILKVHGILPERVVDSCGQKLVNKITKEWQAELAKQEEEASDG